jgi:hypothetical protein
MRIYIHMEELRSLLNRLLHEFVGLSPASNLRIVFCKVHIFLLLEELPQKIIPYLLSSENRQNKSI